MTRPLPWNKYGAPLVRRKATPGGINTLGGERACYGEVFLAAAGPITQGGVAALAPRAMASSPAS